MARQGYAGYGKVGQDMAMQGRAGLERERLGRVGQERALKSKGRSDQGG